ncbi:MAG: adenosylmethionine--8-amino-7-oxononanoate transaminase [Polyangiaceae bacterium]|nr:adenosylmethionine--8-amino-7-oxononanoate transaminase [Polyangiaceae bacterium]
MQQYIERARPLVIERAQGARLFDADGRSYIDGNASWWTALLGHGHPRIIEALGRQSRRLCHTALAGIVHEQAARLADELVQVAPGPLCRVFFSDDGSTAVEVAMKMALQYQRQSGQAGRTRFVALEGAFHGETLGVTALGGVELFRRPFAGVLLDCVHVPSAADGYERAFGALEQLLTESGRDIAAVVLEPLVQGAAGMRIYDARYLVMARELTRRSGVLLVLDEVFTGYGRTGPMWASEHVDVHPDILCTAKGFTAGTLPMAATLVTEQVFEAFLGDASRAFYYGHTFCGNPLGAAVAREVLAIYRDEHVLERARGKARRIAEAFAGMAEIPGVVSTRSLGMIGALELQHGDGYLAQSGWRVYEQALERGAYLRPLGNVVYVTPSLNIDDDELDALLSIVDSSVRAAVSEGS